MEINGSLIDEVKNHAIPFGNVKRVFDTQKSKISDYLNSFEKGRGI